MDLSSEELKNVKELYQSARELDQHHDLNATNANACTADVNNMDSHSRTDRMQNLTLSLMDNNKAVVAAQRSIARTLANNSHPLMLSPNGTDSDSEAVMDNSKCRNFPDVIPHNERCLATSTVTATATPNQQPAPPNTLNLNLNLNIRGHHSMPTHNKLALLRAYSPDILSSESEAELSQYQAAVEANFQSVSLIPNNAPSNKEHQETRKGGGGAGVGGGGAVVGAGGREDISSLDSISNHSFDDDDDVEHNLASLSPSSSLIDGLDDDDDDDEDDVDYDDDGNGDGQHGDFIDADDAFMDAATPKADDNSILPQYSASEEHRDSRNWQKITLPDGRVREIDMRVIEPYKRVLSHGGYLKAGGHNAIVIFCACHLPDHSRADYNYVMDNLFLYVVKTLDQLVTEDYVLIYLHGGSNRRNVPPFPWLKRCYQLLDRRLRKSLKSMYLVHPTFWIKSIVWMARPFVSAKFWRKLVYVKSLEELGTYVTVEKAAIPDKVKHYDAKQKSN